MSALCGTSRSFPDDLPRIECWVHVRTGLAFDEEGQVKNLDDPAWREQCDRLAALGGAPEEAEPRWRLDPILFGPDPTARARAWVERKRWAEAEAAFTEVVAAGRSTRRSGSSAPGSTPSRSQPEKAEADYARAYALGTRDPKLIESIVGSETLFRRTIAESPGADAPLWRSTALLAVAVALGRRRGRLRPGARSLAGGSLLGTSAQSAGLLETGAVGPGLRPAHGAAAG